MNRLSILPLIPLSLLALSDAAVAAPFSGPRVEARVGWDRVSLGAREDGAELFSDDADGLTFGGELGYDADLGGFVLGAYGGIEFSTAEFCEGDADGEACLRARRNFTLGVRGGAAVSDGVLIYAKAGYSNGRLRAEFEDDLGEEGESRSRGGWHGGVGAEFALGRRAYLRAEYVYTRYNAFGDEDEGIRVRLRRHQVIAGLGLRL